jgi:arylsulfatase
VHAPLVNKGHFDQDKWELYHTDVDRSESTDLASEYPEKLDSLKKLYLEEATKNFALPLDDRTAQEALTTVRPTDEELRDTYIYYPHASAVPEALAVNIRGKSYKILANVEIKDANASGVIFAHGSRFGGHSLFIKDHKLYYVYNFLGITEQQLVSAAIKPGTYTFGMEFTKEKAGQYGESEGTAKLYVNDKEVATSPMKAQVGKFTLVGDGLCVGYDSGDPVSKQYKSPGEFTGGTISFVKVSTGNEQYIDLEREAQRAFAVQ